MSLISFIALVDNDHSRAVLFLVTQSCPTLCNPMDCSWSGSSVHGDSLGRTAGVDCHALLQGIFPTQGSNTGLLHCREILYHLGHRGSPLPSLSPFVHFNLWVQYPRAFCLLSLRHVLCSSYRPQSRCALHRPASSAFPGTAWNPSHFRAISSLAFPSLGSHTAVGRVM